MAKKQEDVKKRTVLVAVDGSEHSERAFDCEYKESFVTRSAWRYSNCFRTIDPFPIKSLLIFFVSSHETLKLSAQIFKAFNLCLADLI